MAEQVDPLDQEGSGPAWTFRGYRLGPTHFTTAMVHLYRAEVTRANTWRNRLDTTTNWAVITVGAALTFAFGTPQNPHFVLLLELLLVLTFLNIEARRYQYYVLWSYRAHLMETDFFATMLVPPFRPSPDWADHLVESLLHPTFPITVWGAVGRRFLRNYVWLITMLLVSWGIKLTLHPVPALDRATVVGRAAVGSIPGAWVVAAVGVVYGALVMQALTASLFRAWWDRLSGPLRRLARRLQWEAGPLLAEIRSQERLVIIITARGQEIVPRLLTELERGVTALEGTGAYTGEARDVLLCAVTDVQVSHLKEIVRLTDPDAFVIVSAAKEVRGKRFRPFEAPS